MQSALVIATSLRVLAAMFWAGTSFASTRMAGSEAHELRFAEWAAGVGPACDARQLALLANVVEHYDQVGLGGN